MLPEEPPPRGPLENPPPDPPRAFAKEMVGIPTIDNTMNAAISFVIFKAGFLSFGFAHTMTYMGVSYQLSGKKT
jgi:hypothetical protein